MSASVMLAGKYDPAKARFPYLASAKYDGVRATVRDGRLWSRKMELIPNVHVQKMFGCKDLNGLDGELIVGSPVEPNVFGATVSIVMSDEKQNDEVKFFVFDDLSVHHKPFHERLRNVGLRSIDNSDLIKVFHEEIQSQEALGILEEELVQKGFEGVMLRDPNGVYKFGRSTVRENGLLKVKRFADAEAVITGFEEEMHNSNERIENEMGRAKRSSAKAGLQPKGVLGKLLLRDLKTQVGFGVGSGFTAAQRASLWASRQSLVGRTITYKYQPAGVKDKPRFPVFKGFRDERDM